MPNAVLRGALFGVGRERKIHKKRTLIAAVEGYEIRFKGGTFIGTMIHKAYRDDVTGRYVVIFDKDMLALYEAGYTLIDWHSVWHWVKTTWPSSFMVSIPAMQRPLPTRLTPCGGSVADPGKGHGYSC